MKKEFMASILTLTAGVASTISFPQYSLAQSAVLSESSFEQLFKLMLKLPARYTNANGELIQGHIFLNLDQTPFSPVQQNQLVGEMGGWFYFESDEPAQTSSGKSYKLYIPLVGDDGEVLVDLVNQSVSEGNRYQVYGCNSTLTLCEQESYSITFGTKESVNTIKMSLMIPEYLKIEVLAPTYKFNQKTKQLETSLVWSREALDVEMIHVPLK